VAANSCWLEAFRSTRHRRCSSRSARRSANTFRRCRTAKSGRGGIGSAACIIRCWPRIRSSKSCSGRRRTRTAFKVKDGVRQVRFGDPGWRLGYARDAVNSYFVFRTMKEKGVLAPHLRFQVSIPMVNSVLPPRIFPNRDDIDRIRPGYEAATRAEIATIVSKIPAHELAIQWDCSTEVQDAYGAIPGFPLDGAIERNLTEVRNLAPSIPREVALGYHFCFGTLGGWPRFSPDDLSQTVKLANAFVAASGRQVDWIHIPVLDRSDDAFFAPLRHLDPQGARVYLGAIHNMARFKERVTTARRYLPKFGLAAYCGFGREAPSALPKILNDHLEAVAIAARA
jgi:hypothetical protein